MRLLILLTTILFTTNAIAQDERNGFYLKGELGGNKMQKLKEDVPSEYINDNDIHFVNATSFISKPYVSTDYSLGGGII